MADRGPTARRATGARAVRWTLAFWVVIFVVFSLPSFQRSGVPPIWETAGLSGAAVTGALLCAAVWAAVVRTTRLPVRPRILVVGAAACLIALAQSFLDELCWREAALLMGQPVTKSWGAGIVFNLLMYLWIYGLYAAGVGLVLAGEASREQDRQLAAARAAADQARLAALRFQINPHFLFNALNAATALVATRRNEEAEAVLMRLSDFFRASLSSDPQDLVPLEDEFDVLGSYLEIETARFGERLSAELDLPEALRELLTPHFLLQPLVENAVKHGVAMSKTRVTVRVRASQVGDRLVLTVTDDAHGPLVDAGGPAGAGVGLVNVRARLQTLFGAAADLSTTKLDRGYAARIEMPVMRADAGRQAA